MGKRLRKPKRKAKRLNKKGKPRRNTRGDIVEPALWKVGKRGGGWRQKTPLTPNQI